MGLVLQWIFGPLVYLLTFRSRGVRQAMLLRTMAASLESGIPLVPMLEGLADDSYGSWRFKILGLADLLHTGVSIPEAIQASSGLFPADVISLIRVGSSSGRLTATLRECAARSMQRAESRPWPRGDSMIYLLGLLLVAASIMGFVLYWIIPKLKAIFESFDIDLPPLTLWVIKACDLAVNYWYLFALLIISFGFLNVLGLMSLEGLQPAWGGRSSSLFTRLWPRSKTPLVLRALGIAVSGGRPLERALSELAAHHADRALRIVLAGMESRVAAGAGFWEELQKQRMLRPREAAVLQSAQQAGNLAWGLGILADQIEQKFEVRLRVAAELARPVGILCFGAVIGVFVTALFLPLVALVQRLA